MTLECTTRGLPLSRQKSKLRGNRLKSGVSGFRPKRLRCANLFWRKNLKCVFNVNTLQIIYPMKTHFPRNPGFSLVDLSMVALLIVVMAAFALSTHTSISKGTRLPQAERMLTDQLKLARQYAVTRNHPVEVRFIRYGDGEMPGEKASDPSTGFYRAIQTFEMLENGSTVPIDQPQLLPQNIIMSANEHSTLLTHADLQPPRRAFNSPSSSGVTSDPALPRGIDWNYDYVSFRFFPSGGTDLNSTNGVAWCATLQSVLERTTGGRLPPNFVTLQLDPVTGAVQLFRPDVN